MTARDFFHASVKQALINDGWIITDDPLVVQFGSINLYIDLGAEKVIAAEKEGRRIAVEIKSFLGSSLVSEFHTALGQFLNYRFTLQAKDPTRVLYLAVPADVYESFFTLPFTQGVVAEYQVKILVYNSQTMAIESWIN